MSNQSVTQSPTGRLALSKPEVQFFPGTPEALAQSRKLRAARDAAGAHRFIDFDFSEIELQALHALDQTPPQAKA